MATIAEDYVSFETAKLLIRKGFGFNAEYESYYTLGGVVIHFKDNTQDVNIAPRITLQMAMKWLREIHNIHIVIKIVIRTYGNTEYYYELYSTKNKSLCAVCDIYKGEAWDSNEEACEAAIKYCIDHLILENQDRAPLNIAQDELDWEEY